MIAYILFRQRLHRSLLLGFFWWWWGRVRVLDRGQDVMFSFPITFLQLSLGFATGQQLHGLLSCQQPLLEHVNRSQRNLRGRLYNWIVKEIRSTWFSKWNLYNLLYNILTSEIDRFRQRTDEPDALEDGREVVVDSAGDIGWLISPESVFPGFAWDPTPEDGCFKTSGLPGTVSCISCDSTAVTSGFLREACGEASGDTCQQTCWAFFSVSTTLSKLWNKISTYVFVVKLRTMTTLNQHDHHTRLHAT